MGEQPNKIPVSIGLLAHVDAGKTTLSEALLFESGARRTLGRVDHRDAFLDTHDLERARGITIFSKQARLQTPSLDITLVDTPGHVDFSAEAERVMPILDCAVLVISSTDGIQAHTMTLWRLLERYEVPVFLFINKTDLPGKRNQPQNITRPFQTALCPIQPDRRIERFGSPYRVRMHALTAVCRLPVQNFGVDPDRPFPIPGGLTAAADLEKQGGISPAFFQQRTVFFFCLHNHFARISAHTGREKTVRMPLQAAAGKYPAGTQLCRPGVKDCPRHVFSQLRT